MVKGFKSSCESVSHQLRKKLELKETDPLDPYLLAKYLNIKIITPKEIPGLTDHDLKILLNDGSDSWSAVTLSINGQQTIILNSSHSPARTSSDLMHEISHILLGHTPSAIDVTEEGLLMLNIFNSEQEKEADWMSGTLLLPREALVLIKRKKWDSQITKSIYKVSDHMLNFRLNITGVNAQFSRIRKWPAAGH